MAYDQLRDMGSLMVSRFTSMRNWKSRNDSMQMDFTKIIRSYSRKVYCNIGLQSPVSSPILLILSLQYASVLVLLIIAWWRRYCIVYILALPADRSARYFIQLSDLLDFSPISSTTICIQISIDVLTRDTEPTCECDLLAQSSVL